MPGVQEPMPHLRAIRQAPTGSPILRDAMDECCTHMSSESRRDLALGQRFHGVVPFLYRQLFRRPQHAGVRYYRARPNFHPGYRF
eukprot:4626723-Pyramimonas_sp.AAC.1